MPQMPYAFKQLSSYDNVHTSTFSKKVRNNQKIPYYSNLIIRFS